MRATPPINRSRAGPHRGQGILIHAGQQGDSPMDNASAGPGSGHSPEEPRSFPKHAVVGVVDDPTELMHVVDDLRARGLEPDVLCSAQGAERIDQAGRATLNLRVTRAVQGLFGFEAEHTERHQEEIAAGHFLVLVESHDDETTDRVREAFAPHGGHFVNYYSTWTSRTLIP
jgi:hypothetical protein